MDEQDLKALIFYYCREKYYNCMLGACQDGIAKFRGDVAFNFYNCVALMLCQQFEQSVRELDCLKSENDFRLSVVHAYMQVYKLTGATSNDKYVKLQKRVQDYKVSATFIDLYYVAFVLFAFKRYEDAHEYILSALVIEPSNAELLALQGWIQLYLLKTNPLSEFQTSQVFEMSLKDNGKNFSSSLGIVESYMHEQNYDEAVAVLNKVVVRFPSTPLALLLKMKLNFALQNWDQCVDVIKRISISEPDNVDVLRIKVLMLICNDGKYEEASNYIQQCRERLYKIEPLNGDLLVENAQLFSRVCERNHLVLSETYKMVEKALEISINNVNYMAELAYHSMLLGNLSDAVRLYKSAMKLDDSDLQVLIGMSFCELLEYGPNEHVKHQVNFLVELDESSQYPKLLFLKAKISTRESSLQSLCEICEQHLHFLGRLPYGTEYLLTLDADFMLQVCKELLLHLPQAPALITKEKHLQKPGPIAKKVETVLNVIVKACPSIQETKYLLSTVQFLNGDATKAKANLEQILQNPNSNFTNCYLLMAQIQLYIGQFERASQSLELGLSHNFAVRENPLYHFIMGIIEKNRNNQDEAIKCFKVALELSNSQPSILSTASSLSLYDKATIYLELIDSHMQAGQLHEATKLTESAVDEFRGTSEEARIVILNADQAIEKHEIQHAIDMLTRVKRNESYYLQAKQKLANILLEYRKDTKAYLQCYLDMVEVDRGPESCILLADAYLHVLEVDKALETYEKAVRMNPTDPALCSKMGKAFVETHYFAKAVSYYQEAIKLTDDMELKLQLADLYMRLPNNNDNAEMFITAEFEKEDTKLEEDLSTLQYKAKLLVMLSEIYRKKGNLLGAQKMLRNAKDYQSRVLKRMSLDHIDVAHGEQNVLKDICMQLSEISVNLKDNEGGIALLKEAISIFPNDLSILQSLAQLYIQINNLELCQQTCAMISKLDPDNEEASVMLADIAFRKIDFDMSSFHFTHLLSKQPTNWKALVRFIEVMRRTGELEEVVPYLQQAEAAMNKSVKNPGFSFATAMYQWYSGNLNAALRNFNNARLDPEWGKRAICSMIEICLNPEDEILGEQFFDIDDSDYRDSRSMALKTAERLLKELKQRNTGLDEENLKHRLLGNFLLLATKEKANVEKALEDFTSLASNDILYREEIGPILGMATAHTMLKQAQRAKNQLKRVVKSVWNFEDAEYLERCWLLLADFYIQASKFDSAKDLLQRTLQHNKACTKAYEFLGFIAEKEQSYKDACNYYDNAWKYSGRANPSIGYKLAFNFMKSKRYAEAIDTSQQVLKIHPDYPRIRKDILDKSLTHLRT
ncbi:hypothetical protein PPYR_05941 [Photinus pyralis]|uniref:Tetratricopeptide repeat protein 21B n=1 Tax=Photinus pyralis TaxID=7054 RepID=A0A5N4ASA0_PHOPY|nr:tetratricopeptide repeat protein 21B-like [Photinus pyralis]KAB0800201.1 hypothetical protein PPYR_05941 [Photinus pyralis]